MTATTDSIFRQLAESATDLVTLHDSAGFTLRASGSAGSVLGSAAARLQKARLADLAGPASSADLERAFRATATDGATRHVDWVLAAGTSDEPARHLHSRISRLQGTGGPDASLLCFSHLLPMRIDALSEHGMRYEYARALVDRAAYGIYRSTIEGRFLDVNQSLVKILGYGSPEELLAIDIPSQLYADPSEREVLMRRAREGRLGGWTHARWKMKDGSVITVRVVVNGVTDESGELQFFEGIVEDVTESLRREEVLRRNERMASLGTMLAGVAHELNNPLAAISGFAQIILRGDTLSEDDRAAVDTINHEANRAARIVRDLQTFARERSFSNTEEVDLNEVIAYILATQRYKMESHGIKRVVELAPALPPLRAESVHIEQVFINLIANAHQALESIVDAPATDSASSSSREPPTITIRTASEEGQVLLEIRDNGAGISPEDLPRIFDPFFTTRPEGEGTGLGLAVVHGIVNSYSGNLEVESEPGVGSVFRVSFPVTPGTAGTELEEVLGPPRTAPAVSGKSLEILVIEDESAIRRLLARYFESRGHSVTTAEDGTAALREAEQSAFDVVICDLRLPGIDGFEVLRRLRELPTGKQSRCILMSGANAKVPTGPLREVLQLSAIIDKPFEIEQLRDAVES